MGFAVYGGRTQANARPKFREPVPVINLVEVRERRRIEAEAEQARAKEEAEAIFKARLEQANEAIRKGREAARAYQERELRGLAEAAPGHGPSYAEIERRICKVLGVTRDEVRGNCRDNRLAFARQAIMYWAFRLTPHPLTMIGRLAGGKDHTTVIAAKKKYVEKRAKMGRTLREVVRS